MTVAFVSASAWHDGATGLTADKVLTLPSHSTGNLILVLAAWKTYTITADISGYTEITEFADGTTASGNGSGSMKVGAWYKVAASGAESNPTLDFSSTTTLVGEACVLVFSQSAGSWATPTFATGPWASSAGPATVSATSGTTDVASGTAVVGLAGISDDSATFTRTATAISLTGGSGGITGTYVESPATHASTTTGNDMAADAGYILHSGASRTGGTLRMTIAALTAAETGALLWVVLGDQSAGTTVTPTTAALVITKNIPTVTASNHQSVTPTTAALVATTYAPTIRLGQVVTVPTAGGAGYAAAVLADSPIAYLRLGEPSGTVANDEIMAAEAAYVNTPTLGVTGLLTSDSDTAVTFSRASTEYAYHEAEMPVGSSVGVTIEAWAKFATLTAATFYGVTRWWHTTPTADTQFNYGVAVGALRYLYQDASGFRNCYSDAWTPTIGTTYHLVVTHDYSAESVKFYVNGALLSTEDVSAFGVPVVHAANGWCTIARAGSDYFDGTLDEFAVYNAVLSGTRVTAHYTAGTSGGGLVLTTYAPTIRQGIGVIPTTKALTLATFVPTVRTPILATPTTTALTATRYAPTVRTPILATPAAVSLVLTKNAPTVTATNNQRVTPNAVSLITSPQVPTVTASDQQSVTPTTKALTLATFAPTVTAFQGQTVTPTTATLTLSSFAPTARTPILATPTTASLTATRYAPTVTTPQTVTPTTKALTVTRYEPTVRLHQLVIPGKATLTVTSFVPTVTTPIRAVPGTKVLVLTPFAPAVTAGNVQSVTPTTAAILLTKYVPVVSVTAHLVVTPPAVTLTVTKFAPTVSATAHVAVIPGVKSLTLAPQVPTVTLTAHVAVIVPKATLTLTAYAPSLEQTNDVVAIPTTKSLTLSALTPTVTATANVAFVPTAATLTITKFAPSVRTPILATPATKALTVTRFVPAVRTPTVATPATKVLTLALYQPTLTAPLTVTPQKATLTTTRYAPTIVNPRTVTPITKALTLTAYTPVARVATTYTPITKALVLTGFAPTIGLTFNAVVRPEYGELVITEYPPFVDISGHQGIVPGTAVLVITPYAPTAEVHSITPLPDLIYGFAVIAYGDSGSVGVENGGATVRSEGGGTAVSSSGPSARVTIR